MASIAKRRRIARKKDGRTGQMREVTVEFWRARYRDNAGREHERHFARQVDAQKWLDKVTASRVTGTYVDPKTARTTVGGWCDTWLAGLCHPPPVDRPPGAGAYRADQGGVRHPDARVGAAIAGEGVDSAAADPEPERVVCLRAAQQAVPGNGRCRA